MPHRNYSTATSIFAALLCMVMANNVAYAENAVLLAQMPPSQNLALLGMQVFVAAWIFVLGSCFGSFLNVVIYRLPAGMSLGKPKSRCPQCETPLAARDNIPVFGWMFLKGKCRYCSLPIPPRYPIVEATCGLIFLTLMFGELLTGGENLPLRHPDHFHVHPGFWLVWFAKWDLSGIYFFHCCMLVVLLATVMIGYDSHRPQKKLLTFSLLVGIVCGTMWPDLRPVPGAVWPDALNRLRTGIIWQDFMDPPNRYWTGVTLVGLLDGIVGVFGGLFFGWLVRFAASDANNKVARHSSASSEFCESSNATAGSLFCLFVVVGAFLGWQACGMLAMLSVPLILGHKLVPKCCPNSWLGRAIGPAALVLTWSFLLAWNWLDSTPWMIGYRGWVNSGLAWWQDWLATTVVFAIVCAVLHRLPAPSVGIAEPVTAEPVDANLSDQIDSTSPKTTES